MVRPTKSIVLHKLPIHLNYSFMILRKYGAHKLNISISDITRRDAMSYKSVKKILNPTFMEYFQKETKNHIYMKTTYEIMKIE